MGKPLSRYKPNRLEAQIASGVTIRRPSDALTVGRLLCQQSHAENVLITLDAEGMALVPAGGKGELIAARPRVVHDATGAGDLILAVLGCCGAAGIDWPVAAKLAGVIAADGERSLRSVRNREKVCDELMHTRAGDSVLCEEVMAQNGKRN